MSFTGNENQSITLTQASTWNANYRTANPGQTQGHYFSKSAITSILAQANCVGIRIYYAINDTGGKELVVTGVDASENDLYNGLLADKSVKCPPYCGAANPLNS